MWFPGSIRRTVILFPAFPPLTLRMKTRNSDEHAKTNPAKPTRGLSFELSDLIMVLGWSEFHDLRMVVELDNYIGGEEYEEILAFYPSRFRVPPLVDVALK